MFDSKTLYNILASGTSPDDLAKEFSDALNGAIKKQEEEEKKKKASAEIKTKKMKAVSDIVGLMCDLCNNYYPDLEFGKTLKDLDIEDIVDSLDRIKDIKVTLPKNPSYRDLEREFRDLFKFF